MLEITENFGILDKRFTIGQIINESEIPAIELRKMLAMGTRVKQTTIATPYKPEIIIPETTFKDIE